MFTHPLPPHTHTVSRGLYLGYLKARSTVASMKVICSREYPNVLPHIKIRENPNVSQYVREDVVKGGIRWKSEEG